MDTTAAAGGTHSSSVLHEVIRGTGIRTMGILIMIRPMAILTPATTEIRATTVIRITTTPITTGIMAPRPTATPGILTTDIGMELATAEAITHIPARAIVAPAACITADSADQGQGRRTTTGAPLSFKRSR